MYHEVVASLPGWLVWGVTLGVLASVGTAGAFVLGVRVFPADPPRRAGRVDGDTRRRTEIGEYLGAIGESFAEDHPVAGQEVAFYLPERDVAITFDPRAFYRIRREGTQAVLVEHEMPGVNLGYRLPFDTPDVGPGRAGGPGGTAGHRDAAAGFWSRAAAAGRASDGGRGTTGGQPGDPRDAAFAELGLPAGATAREVKAAYRRKVKEVHPDLGGDEEAFKRVREAYTTAREDAA